jgi:hypothetical protein|tara:strand:+ start:632 stop:892 length:261 start_codon:yes stop_codon:yes gene_type:complete
LNYIINAYKNKNIASSRFEGEVKNYEAKNICGLGEQCNYKNIGDKNPNILLWFLKESYIVSIRLYSSKEDDLNKIIELGKIIENKI